MLKIITKIKIILWVFSLLGIGLASIGVSFPSTLSFQPVLQVEAAGVVGSIWKLPFEAKAQVYTTQSYNGPYSHQGQKALDLVSLSTSSNNTPIVAAKSGKVYSIQQGGIYDSWCSSFEDCRVKGNISGGNYIIIDHLDGTFSYYVHLRASSVLVKVGDVVSQGQKLGLMGGTGYTCGNAACTTPGPHLHFQASQNGQYIDTPFGDCGNCIPSEGKTIISTNTFEVQPPQAPIDNTPKSVFIRLTTDSGKTLDVAGGSMQPQTRILLWPVHGGVNQQWVYYPATEELKNRGLCLDGGNPADPKNRWLRSSTCHGGAHQKWFINEKNELKTRSNPQLCVDFPLNISIPIYLHNVCHGGNHQKWSF